MQTAITLTVSESKRLIAKGLAQLPEIKKAKQSGLIVVCSGTTNGYIVEELLGQKIDKTRYRAGITIPTGSQPAFLKKETMPDMVLRKGEPDKTVDRFTILPEMKESDVYIKGANALNYQQQVAGILIGHPTSGTIGGAYGTLVSKRIQFIIPVGLEKQIAADIAAVHHALSLPGTNAPRLFPVFGKIFTEIQALETLADVKAIQIASGGIAGAEGSVMLLLSGDKPALDTAEKILDGIYGEPAWAEA
jgi:hypothetical protein